MKGKGKIFSAILTAALVFSQLPVTASASVITNEGAESAMSLVTGAAGLGIDKLRNPADADGSSWKGSKVYFGRTGRYPTPYRVLDTDGDNGVLLDSDYALFRDQFDKNESSSWGNSYLKTYLNDDFLLGEFSETEGNAIVPANSAGLSGEKMFLLSESEATNAKYGYGTAAGRKKTSVRLGEAPSESWYLRDSSDSSVKTISSEGEESSAEVNGLSWVSPAMYLDPEKVVMTWPAYEFKPDSFSIVNATEMEDQTLTISGGSGFTAERKDDNTVPAGSSFTVDVSDLGTPDWGTVYTQISAILTNDNRDVIAYGPVSYIAGTGEISVEIPAGVPDGSYTVKLFAEDRNSVDVECAVDFASNVVDLPVKVGSSGDQESEAVPDPGKTSKSNTSEKADTGSTSDTKKPDTKKSSDDSTKAKTHKITVTSQGNGKAVSSTDSAVSGTLIALTAQADAGYHLKGWSSNQVRVAADNTFTMPNQNVTVTAVFEKDAAQKYNITVTQTTGGTISVNPTQAAAGDKVNVSATPNNGWVFVKWNNIVTDQNGTYFIMPAYDLQVSAVFQQAYSLTVTTDGNGSATANPQNPTPGQTVTLFASPGAGYHFKGWQSNEVNPGTTNQFVMPQANVTVKALFEKDSPTTYSVNVVKNGSDAEGGTVSISGGTVHAPGDTVYVDVGYAYLGVQCVGLTVTINGTTQSLDIDGDYFTMPSGNVTVTATFEPLVAPEPDPDPDPDPAEPVDPTEDDDT